MSNLLAKEYAVTRGGRKRAVILEAAERLFSSRGFAATRLEDVAEEVGLTRAALFYHFRDKQTLYDAMVVNAFGSLATQLDTILADSTGTIAARIEMAAEAWVDTIVNRPTLARLILRFVADGIDQPAQRVFRNNEDVPLKFWELFDEGRKSGEFKPLHDDPFHAASAIIGTTVFYVGALCALVPHGQFEPLAPEQIAAHKREALHATRRLLGIADTGN
jgi:TetR/AcrR family transcriptional regulator